MGKYSLTKRRHSHQPKSLQVQPETTAFGNVEQSNSSIRSKQQQQSQRRSTFFQPLAASTPYHIERSNAFSDGSPREFITHVMFFEILSLSTRHAAAHTTRLLQHTETNSSYDHDDQQHQQQSWPCERYTAVQPVRSDYLSASIAIHV